MNFTVTIFNKWMIITVITFNEKTFSCVPWDRGYQYELLQCWNHFQEHTFHQQQMQWLLTGFWSQNTRWSKEITSEHERWVNDAGKVLNKEGFVLLHGQA